MSDEWSTMNLNREKVTREFEVLRRRYMDHRDTVARLAADAPTEHLARQYNAIRTEIETAISKLHELESGGGAPPPLETPRPRTAPGIPIPPSAAPAAAEWQPANAPVSSSAAGTRILAIAAIGIIVLALLGFFAFRTWKKRTPKVAEQPVATTTTAPDTTTTVPLTPASSVAVKPESQDYGTVKKGTRAMRKFDLTNQTDKPIAVQFSRSNCRCLWFDYPSTIPAKGSVTAMVTVDGAKAKKGPLAETIQVTSKNDSTVNASFEVKALID